MGNRLADVLRAEAAEQDVGWEEETCSYVILAKRQDGTFYRLGSISRTAFAQDPEGARKAIERIKFGGG